MIRKLSLNHSAITILLVALCGFMMPAYSGDEEANSEGRAFADDMLSGIEESGENPETTDIPHYQGEAVPEVELYELGAGIEDEALTHALSDENALYIAESADLRPNFEIDPDNDPLFVREEEIVELSRTLSDGYSDCVALPVGTENVTFYDPRSCLVFGYQEDVFYNCQQILDVSCSNDNVNDPHPFSLATFVVTGEDSPYSQDGDIFKFGSTVNNHSGDCTWYQKTVTFWIEDVSLITNFSFSGITYDDWLDIWVNGGLAFRGVGSLQGTDISGTFPCEQGATYSGAAFDAKSRLVTGWNTLIFSNLVGGAGHYYLEFLLTQIYGCDEVDEIVYECEDDETQIGGDLLSSECIDSGTRDIEGTDVYRSCWQWDEEYKRLSDPIYSKESECDEIIEAGCGQVSADCIVQGNGFCATEQLSFECPRVEAARHVDLCGDLLSCPDGDCAEDYQLTQDATDDFKKAATALAVANEIANQIDIDGLSIFTGDGKSCEEKSGDYEDCCDDSGWGGDLGLTDCSAEEEELGIKREQDATHFVGDYCSGDNIFGCYATTYTYCTYPSKLARIIVEQGNLQLSRSYGTAEEPECAGFSLVELEGLDFNLMDLTEFYDDVTATADGGLVGDPDQLIQDLADQLCQSGNC